MKKITKKLLGMLLALAMVLTMIPAMSITASATEQEQWVAKITYEVNGTEKVLEVKDLVGTATDEYEDPGNVYLAQLEPGSVIETFEWNIDYLAIGTEEKCLCVFEMLSENYQEPNLTKSGYHPINSSTNVKNFTANSKCTNQDYYIVDSGFEKYKGAFDIQIAPGLQASGDEFSNKVKTSDVKGFVEVLQATDNDETVYQNTLVYVQISTKSTAPAIAVGSVEETNPGSEITVPVTIANNTGYKGFTAIPSYDKNALELTAVSRGTITADGNIEFAGTEAVTGDSLVDLTFKVKDAAEAGDYEIGLTMDSFYDAEDNAIAADITAGKVTVKLTTAQQINALPQNVTLEDKAQIEAARAAYEALTDEEKAAVSEVNLAKLQIAEAKRETAQAETDKAAAEAAKEQAETDKAAAEAAKEQAETDKAAAEAAKQQAETDKAAAEAAKQQAEADKAAAEAAKEQAETDKAAAEAAKEQAETDKAAAEAAKQQAEADKAVAEAAKEQAETDKAVAEAAQAQAEADKQAAEEALAQAVADKQAAEAAQAKAEKETKAAKLAQKSAEAKTYTVSGLKVTSKSKKLTVTYKKNAKVNGYQVCYKLKTAKKFSTLKTTTAVKVTSKKLKKGKVYQIKVRPYTNVNGKKVYGQWTAVKSVKCK